MPLWSSLASTLAVATTLVSASSHPNAMHSSRTTRSLDRRGATLTGQYETQVLSKDYLLSLNLWGMYAGSGSQTCRADEVDANGVSWETTWDWRGGPSSVKSYSNVALQTGLGTTLAETKSIPVTWDWEYTSKSSDLNADVSYDLWLSKDPSCVGQWAVGCSSYEIMVWLGHSGPSTPAGSPAGTVTVGGKRWTLYSGTVQNWGIHSFVAAEDINSYDGDLMEFFDFLVKEKGVSASEIITTVQGGAEPFEGKATLKSTRMTMKIIAGSDEVPVPSSSSPSTSKPVVVTTVPSSTAVITTKPEQATTSIAVPSSAAGSASSGTGSASALPPSASSGSGSCSPAYAQCGGKAFIGATCCISGYACQEMNEYYSQCVPSSTNSPAQPSSSSSAAASEPIRSDALSSAVTPVPVPTPGAGTGASSLQTFTGALGGLSAPAVKAGGRGFTCDGATGDFHSVEEALDRSCDMQQNACADLFNQTENGQAEFSVADCEQQNKECKATFQ